MKKKSNEPLQNRDIKRAQRSVSILEAENLIWEQILSENQLGFTFQRRSPIDKYMVDFYSAELKLIIEVNSGRPQDEKGLTSRKSAYDRHREDQLKILGFNTIKFSDEHVLEDIDDVKHHLKAVISALTSSTGR